MNKNYYLNGGAIESEKDNRTIKEKSSLLDYFSFPKDGGKAIKLECILDQHRVGICTAISNIEIVYDRTGIRYSEDFQYLLQKKYFDGGWFEGSSVFNSIKASHKYGYLRKEIFDQFFQRNPNEDYANYSARLKSIADNETMMTDLLARCEKKMQGYTKLDNTLPAIAKAIDDTENGVLARFTCGWSWFYKLINGVTRNCWDGEVIEPISEPVALSTFPITGHAVSLPFYKMGGLFVGNSWGIGWCKDGHANIDYMPTEAYKLYFKGFEDKWRLPIKKSEFKHNFNITLRIGSKSRYEIELLQYALIFEDCLDWIPPEQRGYFGLKTLAGIRKFQSKYGIPATGFVGPITLKKLNELYNK
jgi:hypothetical protein